MMVFCCAMVPGDESRVLATAQRKQGITTYLYCLPDRPYDTLASFTTDVSLNSYAGPSIDNKVIGLEKPIDAIVRKALKKAKKANRKKQPEVNGIISMDAQHAVAIHFTTRLPEQQVSRAVVKTYRGYHIFMQNKPAVKYTSLSRVQITSKIDFEFNGYTSVNTMLDSLINRYEKKSLAERSFRLDDNGNQIPVKADALITTDGIEAEFIKMNN